MRCVRSLVAVALLVILLGGCVWTDVVVVAEPAIRGGVAAGVEYGDAELALDLSVETKAELAEKIADKVIEELKKAGEEPVVE